MASAERHGRGDKAFVVIRGRRGKVIVTPEEADEILADLQVMYHMVALGMEEECNTRPTSEPSGR